jgi:hypothetical protein
MRQALAMAFFSLSALLALTGSACATESSDIGYQKAVEIASRSIVAEKDAASYELTMVKRFSAPNNDLIPIRKTLPPTKYEERILKKLQGRRYWIVYYVTRGAEMGGDIGIFIDAATGDVIDIYRGR